MFSGLTDIMLFALAFTLIALASQQIGHYFIKVSLPLISGFLFTGIVAGPYALNLISSEAIASLRFVEEFSLAFIAFAAGNELYLKDLKSRLKSIQWVTIGLCVSTMAVGTPAILFLSQYIPFMQEMSLSGRLAVSLLAASILMALSPATAIPIINELRARGPFTQTVLGVIVIMDVTVIILFAASSFLANALLTGLGLDVIDIGLLFFQLALSMALGYLLGKVLTLILSLRFRSRIKIALILLAGYGVYVLSGAVRQSTQAHLPFEIFLEPLLICMIGGFVVTNFCDHRLEFSKILDRAGTPIFVMFFTLTGASLSLNLLAQVWPIALALFFLRGGVIFIGAFAGGVMAGDPGHHNRLGWMTYITQAGIGLGLAREAAMAFPEWGGDLATIIIAVIVLTQLIGPPLFKKAVILAGEDHSRADKPEIETENREAIIFGLEDQSMALAWQLKSNGWQAKIVTMETTRADLNDTGMEISRVPDISLATLMRLNAGQAEAIIAMLSDEENYQICELAYEHFGTANLVVRLNDRSAAGRFHELGARIVDPGTAIVSLMDQFVRSPAATSLLMGMEENQAIVELELRNPNLHGVALRDLRLPLDTLILSIQRQGQSLISHGYTRLALGDRVTLVGPKERLKSVDLRFDVNRESALVDMVEQMTSREIAGESLEADVKRMIRAGSRENVVINKDVSPEVRPRDRFDHLVEESIVIDIRQGIAVKELYEMVADAMSGKLGVSSDSLFELLMNREMESSTAITQGLAIPHVIIEGSHKFMILLARCGQGVRFSESAPRIPAVFVLVGTKDERNFHLQALSAIAQVVQNPGFEKRWLRARGEQALRNVVLTANRKRLL